MEREPLKQWSLDRLEGRSRVDSGTVHVSVSSK